LNCAMIWGLVYLGIRGLSILTSGIPRTWPFVRQIVPWPLLKIGFASQLLLSRSDSKKISRPCYGQLFSFLFWLLPH
jgi:hypothetical protein